MLRRKSKNFSGPEVSVSGRGVASIAKNTGYLLGTRIYNILIRCVYAIVLAYYLGPEVYGILNYAMSWYLLFLSITGMGTAIILSREIGIDKKNGPRIASITLVIRSGATIFFALLCYKLGYYLDGKLEVRHLILIFSIALIGRSFSIWTENLFAAYETSSYSFYLHTIFRSFEIITNTIALFYGRGVMVVAMVHAISWWLQALCGFAIGHRHLFLMCYNWSWRHLKSILYKSLPNALTMIMVIWLQSGPLVMYRHLSGSENELGQLALAIQAFFVLSNIPLMAGVSSLPILSRSVERDDGKDLLFLDTMIRVAFIFGAAAGLCGLGIGSWLVEILFGTRYSEAGRLLGMVMWLLIPYTCGSVINTVYFARGQYNLPAICAGLGALVLSCIFPWLIRSMNTSGAIISMGIGMWVWVLSLFWTFARSGDIDLRWTVLRPLVVIIFCLGGFFALKSVSTLLAMLLSFTALFCGSMVFEIFTKNEWYLLVNLKRRWSS